MRAAVTPSVTPSMALALALVQCAFGCGGAAPPAPSNTFLRVEGAQYFASAPPAESGGPAIAAFQAVNSLLRPGLQGRSFGGNAPLSAQSVALSLTGDTGYWVIPTGLPDPLDPSQLTFGARASFSRDVPSGPAKVEARALDAAGRVGPAFAFPVTVLAQRAPPPGELVFSLTWTGAADLDLHVVAPDGTEVWAGNINSYKGGVIVDPVAAAAGGVLDFDSNSACLPDGFDAESISWKSAPPAGRYTVRVDAFSLCGDATAWWTLQALRSGAVVAEVHGFATADDTARPHRAGAGTTALLLQVP